MEFWEFALILLALCAFAALKLHDSVAACRQLMQDEDPWTPSTH